MTAEPSGSQTTAQKDKPMLYVDVPDQNTLNSLIGQRADMCVSIYLATTPLSQEAANDPIKLKNAARKAIDQLEAISADKRRIALLEEHIDDLVDDDEFWRFQAHGLAVLATPDKLRTFRMASRVSELVEVSDRFHLGPLFRSASVGQNAYVLALAEGDVRLVAVTPDMPAALMHVEGLPKDAASAVGRASTRDRSPSGRLHGSEGQKVLLRQYARIVDNAVGALLRGQATPLILAADTRLASIFRSVSSYPHLAEHGIDMTPDKMSPAEIADLARPVLDVLHRGRINDWRKLFDQREPAGRATTNLEAIARAATFGAVDSLLIDIDQIIEGRIDEETGVVTRVAKADAINYDLIDEIAGRVTLSGGAVYGVRADDIPHGAPLAAILRFAI